MPRAIRAWFGVLAAAVIVGACESPRQVSTSGFGAYEVSLAAWNDVLAVAWYDTRDGNAEIYLRYVTPLGRELGTEHRLTWTDEESYEADIAAIDDGLAVAWYERSADGSLRAQLGLWDRARKPLWQRAVAVGNLDSRNPLVRAHDNGLFCAWIEQQQDGQELVWARWWDHHGRPLGAPVRVGRASATTWNLNAAVDADGVAYVAYDALVDTEAEELFVGRVVGEKAELVRFTADDGHASKYPDIGVHGERLALTWFDERDGNQEVYLAVGSLEDLRAATESRARRVTDTAGHSIGAYLAWNGERVGLAWSDDSDGSYEVYFQPFDADGRELAAAQRLTENSTDSLIPAIRPWRDQFAVAWSEVIQSPRGGHDPQTRAEVMFTLAP